MEASNRPVLIAFDGTPSAQEAVREAGELLNGRPALVVVVYKQGIAFELLETPATIGLPPAPLDIRTAMEIDAELAERAQALAQQGAELARQAGLEASGMAVAEEVDTAVADTIVRVASESHAQAVVVGAHGHGTISEMFIGSTSRDVIRHAPCPVVVVREGVRGSSG
jgi:nucleotide-binding universal stress UspA family protein